MKKSKIFMMVSIIVLLISIVGSIGTYAWFTWSSTNNTSLTLRVGTIADITFDTGNNINTNSLTPVFNYTDGEMTTFSITNKDNTGASIIYSVKLKIENISQELISSSLKYKLISNGEEVGSGSFLASSSGAVITIARNKLLNSGITDFTFYLYIDGNMENDINMMDKNITAAIEVEVEEGSPLTSGALTIANLFSPNMTVVNNNIVYQYDTVNNLMDDTFGNIRYYGASPNNYIYFNCGEYSSTDCELWRIIGVFDGKIKLIRNESIGSYSWDTSSSDINGGQGINQWGPSGNYTGADLMKLLNPGYESNTDLNQSGDSITVNNSLYYNSSSGICYNGQSNATTSCNFTSSGLKNDITRNMILETTWYLGGEYRAQIYSNAALVMEKGETVINNPSDGIIRTTSWTGKIALMYPSDYGYATDFTKCGENLYNYNSSTDSYACRSNDWLYSGRYSWPLTSNTHFAHLVWRVYGNGTLGDNGNCHHTSDVLPVLYLNSNISIIDGIGTKDNPYVIE